MAPPAAGFGDFVRYPGFAFKAAVLIQAVASRHPLPDENKRTALLCGILFANLNNYAWNPPEADDSEGLETAEIIEAAAVRAIPLPTLAAWVDERLRFVSPVRRHPPS